MTGLGTPSTRSLAAAAFAAVAFAHSGVAQSPACGAASTPTNGAQSPASWAPPLDRAVTAGAATVSLRNALDRVAAAAKLSLSYSAERLPLDSTVCLSADASPVGQVLADLLAGTNLGAVSVGGDQIVLALRAPGVARQTSPAMAPSVGVLERVVVTGSANGAPDREVSDGRDVVTGRQLLRDNTGTLSGALDSYVPGLWSWSQSPSSILASYGSIRGASSFGLSYPKIYIDGIEVANPLLISRFAPEAIDRIEVIRGPQGSALYGTDAISGVVNIITRHDGADPDGTHASVRTTAGVTQSAFAHGVLSQEHALSLAGGTSTGSADLHVSGGSVGDFIPNGYSRDVLASGSARTVGELGSFSGTARFYMQQSGSAASPLLTRAQSASDTGAFGQPSTPQSVSEYTIATTTTLASTERWTHSFVAGIDGYRLSNVQNNFAPIPSVADSALRAAQGGADRATLRATSVLNLGGADPTHAALTFSAEHAALRETSVGDQVFAPIGRPLSASRQSATQVTTWQTSTGLTTQANVALDNAFFVVGGVRLERDSRLDNSQSVAVLPMLGTTAVEDVGPFTVKLRAAYGKGVRPPSALNRAQFWQASRSSMTPQSLGAETQSGIEGGIDVFFRRTVSFKLTRFDQRASGLIQQVAIPADSNAQSHRWTYALENVGEISNRGWEMETSANIDRLLVSGTLSLVDSRVEQLATGYTGDLRTGDRMLQVPARTGSLNLSWLGDRWYASLGGSRALDWINYDELALAQAFTSGSTPARDLLGAQLRKYWGQYNGAVRVHAAFSRDIRDTFAFQVSAENLLNYQRNEPDNLTVLPGRTVMTGVRVKF